MTAEPSAFIGHADRSVQRFIPAGAGNAFSDLRQNNIRGHVAEYIVGLALDLPLTVRSAWDHCDLGVPAGQLGRGSVRLQVKSAAYLQAWGQRKHSAITFGGLRRRPFPWSAEKGFVLGEGKLPKADVFVFAIETAQPRGVRSPGGRAVVVIPRPASPPHHAGYALPRDTLEADARGDVR